MEDLKKRRRPVRAQLTRMVNEADKALQEQDSDKNNLAILLDNLEKLYHQLEEWDEKVKEQLAVDGVQEDEEDKEYDEIRKYGDNFKKIRIRLEKLCNIPYPFRPPSPTTSERSFSTARGIERRAVQLPKIELRKFGGELKEWLAFWSQFKKIDEDPELDGCDKFHYLLQSMENGTKAYQIVASYPQTTENYPKVVETLKARFGNEDILLQVYVRELLKLVISNVNAREKVPFESLVLQLDSSLRALKTLKLEEADPATWLFPLVESSLPSEILLTWQRSPLSKHDGKVDNPQRSRLDILMDFLKSEVEYKERIELAETGFNQEPVVKKKIVKSKEEKMPTLAGFHIGDSCSCVFCGKGHPSQECFSAIKMSYEDRRKRLTEKKACFLCLKTGHLSTKCKATVMCVNCGQRHHTIMCNPSKRMESQHQSSSKEWNKTKAVKFVDSDSHNKEDLKSILRQDTDNGKAGTQHFTDMFNHVCTSQVVLMTLMVDICATGKRKSVRAFLDPGSQRSYILKRTAEEVGLEPVGEESATHSLFGGTKTAVMTHKKYAFTLGRLGGGFQCQVKMRDSKKICNNIPRISRTPELFHQLKREHIYVTDIGDNCPEIELLIGADIYGRLQTGKVIQLEGGITAQETKLGWTLSGEHEANTREDHVSMMVLSMTATDAQIEGMWSLEAIGIQDDAETKSREQLECEAKQNFVKTLSRKEDGRYIAALPWMDDHPALPNNRSVAEKRLVRETKKLIDSGKFDTYDNLLKEWNGEFTEVVTEDEVPKACHYVPHRPVFKESLTTPVRPVFDCSCKTGKSPSLNDCLWKGSNYVQLIPELLLRFREKRIGRTADIKKAFQMIEIQEQDRDYLRFLWWTDKNMDKLLVYRHVRLLFGATSSPFILGAVLEHHLKNIDEPHHDTALKLFDGFYVDNYLGSENTMEEYHQFRDTATTLMAEAKMDLRMWMSNQDAFEDSATHVISILGLQWDRKGDCLFVATTGISKPEILTKRVLLSTVQKIFDPLGFLSPALIPMKRILQQAWISKMKWDEALPEQETKEFFNWLDELAFLQEVKVPRLVTAGERSRSKWSLHTFTDSSCYAFACNVYLRVETESGVHVQLLMAKARVAPLKRMTIPRLELMGCLIGSRLAATVKKSIDLDGVSEYYWSDSSVALAWIKKEYNYSVFVRNRVREIREKTGPSNWKHVPGQLNPADLPSRGCSPAELLASRWWEGPEWLKNPVASWPSNAEIEDEDVIMTEVRKTVEVTSSCFLEEARKQYTFPQSTRIMAWVLRFLHNARKQDANRRNGPLTEREKKSAEIAVLRDLQQDAFPFLEDSKNDKKGLKIRVDEHGLIRIETRLVHGDDLASFKYPILLPKGHPMVTQIIFDAHRANCHAGANFLMAHLRENFWILQCRKTIKQVIDKCHRCRRYAAKPVVVEEAPLPADRIGNTDPFEVTGVDLAGPIYLKDNKKSWIVIYTCAVYRAVWLDIVTSLSAAAFVKSLKRFIEKHGRPVTIYSDNGTNFVGAHNQFKQLDWNADMDKDIRPIQWKFNPPSAAWWGGWWERLIRSVKDMLRKTLGRAHVTLAEMKELLEKITAVMNGRPLTMMTEDPMDLEPLTPALFLKTPLRVRFPEGEMVEGKRMQARHLYMTRLKEELRKRFRREYLALLVSKSKRPTRPLEVGEVVFVGDDIHKRLEWPIGRILKLFPGRDGVSRVARVKTAIGELDRPVQRLHPLEVPTTTGKELRSRSGRKIQAPVRLGID